MHKKQAILDYCREHNLEVATEAELQALRSELGRRLGPRGDTSLAYIASVLRAAGRRVQYEDPYSASDPPEPYASRLRGALEFQDLAGAERCLLKLDRLYREYLGSEDRQGTRLVCALAKKGKLRARSLAANPRVGAAKRREKEEITHWFQVWLETPDLFRDWVELRKASEEYQALFGRASRPEI